MTNKASSCNGSVGLNYGGSPPSVVLGARPIAAESNKLAWASCQTQAPPVVSQSVVISCLRYPTNPKIGLSRSQFADGARVFGLTEITRCNEAGSERSWDVLKNQVDASANNAHLNSHSNTTVIDSLDHLVQ